MTTYLLLNCMFFAALALLLLGLRRRVAWRAVALALCIVMALTTIFDPIMIAVGLVEYDSTKLLGLYLFGAPVEDFAYALFAVPFVAAIWHMTGERQ